ncbi:MAG TPA: hypothetical protein VFB79_01575 [Candidatus Angelobacter sp.]|nr:hypothetical protein [Candidatus Angelobacter sp.]
MFDNRDDVCARDRSWTQGAHCQKHSATGKGDPEQAEIYAGYKIMFRVRRQKRADRINETQNGNEHLHNRGHQHRDALCPVILRPAGKEVATKQNRVRKHNTALAVNEILFPLLLIHARK